MRNGKMDSDNKEIAKRYINYSLWWVRLGSKIHEKRNAELRELIARLEKEGYSEQDAFCKASKEIDFEKHPDEDCSDQVDEISKNGNKNALELIKTIVELAPDDEDILCYIGAGPYENWVQKANYEEFKDEIDLLYGTKEKWRVVIESSWHNPDELERKL